jgi:Holliday junction resolvase
VSRSTRAGTAAERAVVTYLQANGFPHAERAPRWGARDRGDVLGMPGVVVEVKAQRALNLAAALAEAQVEAANAGVRRYLAVLKRRRRPVGEWYALMPLWLAVELLGEDGR